MNLNLKFLSTKGIVLEQKKEPALSRDLQLFVDETAESRSIEPLKEGEEADTDRLIRLCADANIVDEREGEELCAILRRWKNKKVACVVGDAIDDEPYVSSQTNPMMRNSAEAAYGLRLLQKAFGAEKAYFAVYREMHYLNCRIPTKIEEFPVRKMGGKYPMEQRAVRRLGDDVLTVGVCALIHLARAAQQGTVQSTCFITVAGNCVGNPCNMEVTIGTSAAKVLERCGLVMDPTSLSINSAMKGRPLEDRENTLIRPETRAIIAIKEAKKNLRHMDCIGCGRCLEVCPENLNPMELYRAASNNRKDTCGDLGIDRCISCSACSYICPSKLEISHIIQYRKEKWQKGEVKDNEREQ